MKKATFIAFLVAFGLFPSISKACVKHRETMAMGQNTTLASDISHNNQVGYHKDTDVDLYAASREAMHQSMNVAPTGNPDADFILNMIPHHQGALDMAKVQLDNGKDPELRKLAEEIIAAQEKEITQMKKWLKKHGY